MSNDEWGNKNVVDKKLKYHLNLKRGNLVFFEHLFNLEDLYFFANIAMLSKFYSWNKNVSYSNYKCEDC